MQWSRFCCYNRHRSVHTGTLLKFCRTLGPGSCPGSVCGERAVPTCSIFFISLHCYASLAMLCSVHLSLLINAIMERGCLWVPIRNARWLSPSVRAEWVCILDVRHCLHFRQVLEVYRQMKGLCGDYQKLGIDLIPGPLTLQDCARWSCFFLVLSFTRCLYCPILSYSPALRLGCLERLNWV